MYTTSAEEAYAAISSKGFTVSGLPCYVFANPIAGLAPLYLLDNPTQQDSLLTSSLAEAQDAVAHGYTGQVEVGHVLTNFVPGSVPVYRLSKSG